MPIPVDPARYAAFLPVMAVMSMAPGPANLFAIATGAQKGKAAALVGVAGMNIGTLVWFGGAALGLGALIAAWPTAFQLLSWIGAAYLAWLGGRSLWSAAAPAAADEPHELPPPGRSAFRDGFAVQMTNPKALLFFTAILPPFLDASRPMAGQLTAFGAAAIGMDLVFMSAYGLGGAALAARMAEPQFRRGFQGAVGLLLLSAALLIGFGR